MKLEDALKLEAGPALNALVAEKVMGALFDCDGDLWLQEAGGWSVRLTDSATGPTDHLPRYSEDIAEAFDLPSKVCRFQLSKVDGMELWSCRAGSFDAIEAPTPELAIARAVLQALWQD